MSDALRHRWFVVHTQPNGEAKAQANLARQGFDTYLPRYLKKRSHARRVEMVPAPYFPRYIFVAVDMVAQRWRAISSTVGVSRLVTRGDEPAAVVASVVAELRQREGPAGFLSQQSATDRYKAGDIVRVREGVFSDLCGEFEAATDAERVALLLEMLGRKVRIELDVMQIEAA